MQKLFLFIFLFMITHICAGEWALKEKLYYEPITMLGDLTMTAMRKSLDESSAGAAPNINPNIKIVRYATPDEQCRKCLYFALKTSTGFTGSCPWELGPKILQKYWHQIDDPKPGDLAVYLKNSTSIFPNHYAVVKEVIKSKNKLPYIFLSKWGSHCQIMEHEPFDAPKSYGKAIVFFTPKHFYKSDKPRLALLMSKELANPYEEKISNDDESDVFLVGFYIFIAILKITGLT